ncbi:MAG: hypothetical protein BRD55_10890 [Bacteroidetes bacterium SW_9_63_38]|nr:MAG: hypothetical protein BRD55_10890 [Bacteroidetes bacterium SW_9_63_38]
MSQKAVIVRTGPDGHDGLEALNVELERGWRVAKVSPMGGADTAASGPTHAALVILERRERRDATPAAAVAALEELEAESRVAEDIVEEADDGIEGNGTDSQSSSSAGT